jgi:hypothetical protein
VLITANNASTAAWLEAGWPLILEGDWLAEFIVGEKVLEELDEGMVALPVPVDPVEPDGM